MIRAFFQHLRSWWAAQSPDKRPSYMTYNSFLQR